MENDAFHEKIDRDVARYSVDRMIALTRYCVVIYLVFGIFSLGSIRKFAPEVELWDSVWPRIIFVALPFLGLHFFMKRSTKSEDFKMSLWCVAFSLINAASACVYVWPIAYRHPEIILYFNSVNNVIFVCTGLYLGLPNKNFFFYLSSWCLFFFTPLMLLTMSNDAVFSVVITDVFLYSATLIFMKKHIKKSYQRPIEDKFSLSKFIDEDVSKAFEEGADLDSLSGRKNIFILQLDVRGYSDFLNANDGDDKLLLSFSSELNKLMRGTIKKYAGKTHKTAGDGYLCLFVEPFSTDGIAHLDDIGDATITFRKNQLSLIVKAFHEINLGFKTILEKHGLENMWVCGAIHFGQALFEFFGDNHRLEYDVVSKNLALAARLEEFTKRLQIMVGPNNYLVLSVEAWEYFVMIDDLRMVVRQHEFSRVEGDKIRSFENIERVYFIRFAMADEKNLLENDSVRAS